MARRIRSKHAFRAKSASMIGQRPAWLTTTRIAALIVAVVLIAYVPLAYYLFGPAQPALIQRSLGLICAGLALTSYLLATRHVHSPQEILGRIQRGQHADFGKRLREKRSQSSLAIPLPGGRRLSVRTMGAVAVFVMVFGWWLTPAAPVGVAQRELEDLTVALGEQIIATDLISPDATLVFWQTPVMLPKVERIAREIDEDAPAYHRALQAVVRGDHDRARLLLGSAMREGDAEVAQISLARAQNELFAADFEQAVTQYANVLAHKPDDVSIVCQAAIANLHAGDLKGAERLADRAFATAQSKPDDDPALGMAFYVRGLVMVATGRRIREAERVFAQAQNAWDQSLPPDHPLLASSRNNQGMAFFLVARYPQAREMVNWARDNWQRSLGPVSPLVATACDNQAMIHVRQGRLDEARSQLNRADQSLATAAAVNRPIVAVHRANVGRWQLAGADYNDAITSAEHAYNQLEERLGAKHVLLGGVLNLLGDGYYAKSLYTKSEAYYFRALAIVREACGVDHPYAALIELNLAQLNVTRDRLDLAKSFLNHAKQTLAETVGSEHPDMAEALVIEGQLALRQGDAKTAATLWQEARDIRVEALGEQHPASVLASARLATLVDNADAYRRGVTQLQESIETLQETLDPAHPTIAGVHFELAKLHLDRNNHAEAAEPLKECYRIRKERLPPYHPDRAATLNAYATVLEHAEPPDTERAAKLRAEAKTVLQSHIEQDRVEHGQ